MMPTVMVKHARPRAPSIERRLFDISLGGIRLLDSVLEKCGQPDLAEILREMLINWRGYPSLSVFSKKDLRKYAKRLGQVGAGLHRAGHRDAAQIVEDVKREIQGWINQAR
jgi:hypothetical protein